MATEKKKVRWRYLIDKKFQGMFILNFSFLLLFGMLLSLAVLIYLDRIKYAKGLFFTEQIKEKYITENSLLYLKQTMEGLEKIQQEDIKVILAKVENAYNSLSWLHKEVLKGNEAYKKVRQIVKELVKEVGSKKVTKVDEVQGKIVSYVNNLNYYTAVGDLEQMTIQASNLIVLAGNIENENMKKKIGELYTEINAIKTILTRISEEAGNLEIALTDIENSLESAEVKFSGLAISQDISASKAYVSEAKKVVQVLKTPSKKIFVPEPMTVKKPYNLFQLYWKVILWLSILYLVLIAVFGLFYSHRMAGPLHRIKREIREIAEGTRSLDHKIKLRKGDFFHDLADELNYMFEKLRERGYK